MTGAVSWETLQWVVGIIVAVVVAAGTALGVMWRVQSWITGEFQKRDDARAMEYRKLQDAVQEIDREHSLAIQATDARAKLAEDSLAKALADHRLFAAEHFATEEGVAKALEPVIKALDKISDRLDQFMSGGGPRPRPRTD